MQDFPPNSRKAAQATEAPREKLKPVTSAETRPGKNGLGRKFKETFFGGSARDAARSTATDVIIPSIRDLFHDAAHNALDYIFYGDRTVRPRSTTRSSGIMSSVPSRVAYDQMNVSARPTKASAQQHVSRQARARHSLEELIIPSSKEANEVIDRLFDVLSIDGQVSIAALYELTNVRPEHTDFKWGWRSLQGARAVRLSSGGYLLNLPEPEPLV